MYSVERCDGGRHHHHHDHQRAMPPAHYFDAPPFPPPLASPIRRSAHSAWLAPSSILRFGRSATFKQNNFAGPVQADGNVDAIVAPPGNFVFQPPFWRPIHGDGQSRPPSHLRPIHHLTTAHTTTSTTPPSPPPPPMMPPYPPYPPRPSPLPSARRTSFWVFLADCAGLLLPTCAGDPALPRGTRRRSHKGRLRLVRTTYRRRPRRPPPHPAPGALLTRRLARPSYERRPAASLSWWCRPRRQPTEACARPSSGASALAAEPAGAITKRRPSIDAAQQKATTKTRRRRRRRRRC